MVGTSYWSGLLDWIRGTLLEQGAIAATDLGLWRVTDDPDEVVEIIRADSPADPAQWPEAPARSVR